MIFIRAGQMWNYQIYLMDNLPKEQLTLNDVLRYLLIVFILITLLYLGRILFVPMFFGLLIAIIAYPACKWLESRGFARGLAVGLVLTAVILIFASLLWLLGYEISLFLYDLPLLKNRLAQMPAQIGSWLKDNFGMKQSMQDDILEKMGSDIAGSISYYASSALTATATTIVALILIPVYGVLFLFHRGTFVKFLESIIAVRYKEKLNFILQESIITYYRFVKGTFFVYCIVGVLNSVGLLVLGIRHALLFGMLAAFMTIVPYVGIIISASLPISIALVTKDSIWYAIGVIMVFTFVQYLEANVIFPKIVGEQLNLSTWAVLVAMIAGTILWGLSGMILFVPFAAILKIISDNVEEWKPLNILLNRES